MKLYFVNCRRYVNGRIELPASFVFDIPDNGEDKYFTDKFIFPAFCDVHVHLREPGFSYKETVASGTAAAARGGFTDVCTMPNLSPVPDSAAHMKQQLDIIKRDARVRVHPFAALTVGEKGQEPAALEELAPLCIGFSDDGKGVQSRSLMLELMQRVKKLGSIISAHCEDEALVQGGYINKGAYALAHGHAGISAQSEWRPIARDLELAAQTGCKYHVCHVSCRESVELLRRAKAAGLDVTCETAPHYLLLDEGSLREDGRFKMNPPLRTGEDRTALIDGLLDGTVDMIATDHAPHAPQEKSRGLKDSLMGVTGLETAFAALYTGLVKPGILPLEKLVYLMTDAPRERFGIEKSGDICVFDTQTPFEVRPEEFLSMGKSTPFAGKTVQGKCLITVCGGKTVWTEN